MADGRLGYLLAWSSIEFTFIISSSSKSRIASIFLSAGAIHAVAYAILFSLLPSAASKNIAYACENWETITPCLGILAFYCFSR